MTPPARAPASSAATLPPATAFRSAVVIGGGLAGMTAAKELAKRGLRVTILDGSDVLGGKATARQHGDYLEDHGFHIFAPWYENTRALLREIDCERHLIDIHRTHFLRRGQYPQLATLHEWSSISNALVNVFDGVLPWHESILAFYFITDLASEPYANRAFLDRLSGYGLFRSRFYVTEVAANFHHQTVLQAAAIPYWECSAMTLQRVFKAWLAHLSPCFSMLNGNLRDKFIDPYVHYLESLGVQTVPQCRVVRLETRDGRVRGLICEGRNQGRAPQLDADTVVVLAVPHGDAWKLIDTPILDAESRSPLRPSDPEPVSLANLGQLVSAPMAALHIHLDRRLRNFPKEHINLLDSRFGITVVDVAPHWGLDHTTLNLIAANFLPLMHVSQEDAKRCLLEELAEFIPDIDPSRDLPLSCLQTHQAEPLFLNTVGAWPARPQPTTAVDNLFMAGDYCRTEADLATMESAVLSGLNAAQAILGRDGKRPKVRPLPLSQPPAALLSLLRYAPLPLVFPITVVKQLQSQLKTWQERWQQLIS